MEYTLTTLKGTKIELRADITPDGAEFFVKVGNHPEVETCEPYDNATKGGWFFGHVGPKRQAAIAALSPEVATDLTSWIGRVRAAYEDLKPHVVRWTSVCGWDGYVEGKFDARRKRTAVVPEIVKRGVPRVSAEEAYDRAVAQYIARQAREKEAAGLRAACLAEAKTTGKPVVIETYTAECNDRREECNMDIVTVYAQPDGTVTTSRKHTW